MRVELEQNLISTSDILDVEKEYWLKQLSGKLIMTNFPYDYNISYEAKKQTDIYQFSFPRSLAAKLNQISTNSNYNLYIILVASLVLLLNKLTGKEDIIIGAPILKQNVEGNFINTVLILRNFISNSINFKQLLGEVKRTVNDANDHLNYPLQNLIKQLDIETDRLIDVLVLLKNIHAKSYIQETDYNVLFTFEKIAEETIEGQIEYSSYLYQKQTIEKIAKTLMLLIENTFLSLETPLEKIPILTEFERQFLLNELNLPEALSCNQHLIDLFEEQAHRKGNNIALSHNNQQITYKKLNQMANQLVRKLRKQGVKKNSVVGIIIKPSFEMLIGILGVLKAGGTYLPIDPDFPAERIDFMLRDSGAQLILTSKDINYNISGDYEIIDLTDQIIYKNEKSNLKIERHCEDIIYIIYTSGTTGQPKGVPIKNNGLINYILWLTKQANISEDDVGILMSSFCFDLCYTALYPPLINGGRLHLVSKETYLNPSELLNELKKNRVTYIKTTPSFFSTIVNALEFSDDDHLKTLRLIVLGGEEIKPIDLEKYHAQYPETRIMNHYGPTETTIGTIFKEIDFSKWESYKKQPVIGRAIDRMQVYVLNEQLRLLPLEMIGEIHIAGPGLATGYWNQKQLTEKKFIPNPFDKINPKLFKTGDLGRVLPDGDIEFLGRRDYQVKIRGYRIELGEIEKVLAKHESISEVVVLVKQTANNENQMIAYIVSREPLIVSELRKFMLDKVPLYMIPTYFVQIEEMPLTLNGKINRKLLPQVNGSLGIENEYLPPETKTEEELVAIWEKVLDLKKVGVNYNFFDLGGNSLNAINIVSMLHQKMNMELPLGEFFSHPTIRELAEYMSSTKESRFNNIPAIEEKEYYPASSAQKRLFVLSQLENIGITYNTPTAMIIKGDLDVERFGLVFEKLIKRHETFRTSLEILHGEVIQRVHKEVKFDIDYLELEDAVNLATIINDFIRPFDLAKAPLFRVKLVKLAQQKGDSKISYLFVFDMHHTISDLVSKNILIREILDLYEGRELPKLRIQYKDFTVWQNELFASQQIKKQKEYWLNHFTGEIPILNLPTDYPRSSNPSFAGDHVYFEVSKELTVKTKEYLVETESTLYILLLAVYNVLLFKYTGQEDIIIGSPITGRSHSDLDHVVGMFVNMLSMRNYPHSDLSFDHFLKEVKKNSIDAFANQNYQYEELVRNLGLKRNSNQNPIFSVVFALQNVNMETIEAEDFQIISYNFKINNSAFDLLLNGVEEGENIRMWLYYKVDLFKKSTVQEMAKDFLDIFEQILDKPDLKLSDIEISHKYLSLEAKDLEEQSQFNF